MGKILKQARMKVAGVSFENMVVYVTLQQLRQYRYGEVVITTMFF